MSADEVPTPCPDCYGTGIVVTPIGKSRNPSAARKPCPRGCNMWRKTRPPLTVRARTRARMAPQ